MPFGTEKLEWLPDGEKFLMFFRFDRIHERDKHTQTPHDDIGRACIASRGKNEVIFVHRNLSD